MEVHHHSHPAQSGRKKWSHYFWEFLMLFLAVFCGYLAEYQLEHKIEKERGRAYIVSLYKDLVTDTSTFTRLIDAYEEKVAVMKSRVPCYDSVSRDLTNTGCLKTLVFHSLFFPDLIYTDRTLQQLKNAGGLRLLKTADADSILQYDNMLKAYKSVEETVLQETQTGIRSTLYSLINNKAFNGDNSQPLLYNNDKDLLNRYFNQLIGYAAVFEGRIGDVKNIKKKAVDLIEYFKERYHLN
jgi:hypothetical protein